MVRREPVIAIAVVGLQVVACSRHQGPSQLDLPSAKGAENGSGLELCFHTDFAIQILQAQSSHKNIYHIKATDIHINVAVTVLRLVLLPIVK